MDASNGKDPTVFEKLLEPILSFIKNQDQELDKHPGQTFAYFDFVRTLIYFFATSNEHSSIRLLMSMLKKGLIDEELKIPITPRSTFNDAFSRFSVDLFRDVFAFLLSELKFVHIPELAVFGTLYCIDGSLFPVISSMIWAEYKTDHNALKLHLCFELNRMIAVDFIIGTGKSNERDALRKMLVSGVTYIADRGYMCFKLFYDIANANSFFIFRVKYNLQYNITDALEVQLPNAVKYLFENVTDTVIQCVNDPYNIKYRLVRFHAGIGNFFILTNRFDLTTFQIIILYAYRWQIELMFRFLKRSVKGLHLINQSPHGATIQFYALLIVSLLEIHLKQQTMPALVNTNEQIPVKALENNEIFTAGTIDDTCEFFKIIGSHAKEYWKIGIHWLVALQKILATPFNKRAIEILNSS